MLIFVPPIMGQWSHWCRRGCLLGSPSAPSGPRRLRFGVERFLGFCWSRFPPFWGGWASCLWVKVKDIQTSMFHCSKSSKKVSRQCQKCKFWSLWIKTNHINHGIDPDPSSSMLFQLFQLLRTTLVSPRPNGYGMGQAWPDVGYGMGVDFQNDGDRLP
jgi:hypothetical protein